MAFGAFKDALRSRLGVALLCLAGPVGAAAAAEPLRIFAAGSLVEALKEEVAAAGLAGSEVAPTFGPAGILGRRLLAGEGADLFLSADTRAPASLVEAGRAAMLVPFARNTLCVFARAERGLAADTLVDRLLDPALRLATSTPVDDPGGDYAFAALARADAVHPGAGAALQGKALKLLGAPATMIPVAGKSPGASVFLLNRADALLYYCSAGPRMLAEVPGLVSVPLPPSLAVPVTYAMAVMTAKPEALRFALFILSAQGQMILARSGLEPLSTP